MASEFDKLQRLTNFMAEDVLETPGDELIAEFDQEHGGADQHVAKMRKIVKGAIYERLALMFNPDGGDRFVVSEYVGAELEDHTTGYSAESATEKIHAGFGNRNRNVKTLLEVKAVELGLDRVMYIFYKKPEDKS